MRTEGDAHDLPTGVHVVRLRIKFDVSDDVALSQFGGRLFGKETVSYPAAMILARAVSEAVSEFPGIALRDLSADWVTDADG